MLLLRQRLPSRHRHDVRQKRRNPPMVLLKQMQKELVELQKRRTQTQMDNILRQRRERKRLKPQAPVPQPVPKLPIPFLLPTAWTKLYLILTCITPRKNCFINTHDTP